MQASALSVAGQTAHKDWIVVDDPGGKWGEGSLIDFSRSRQLGGRGITVLPVCPELFRSSGVGGYYRRSWGSGYPLSATVPMYQAPVVIGFDATSTRRLDTGVNQTAATVHWAARLVRVKEDVSPTGMLRLASDSSQQLSRHAPTVAGKSTVIDLGKLEGPDRRGGWTVGGNLFVTPPMPGHYGFALFGMGPGLAVRWIAASVTFADQFTS